MYRLAVSLWAAERLPSTVTRSDPSSSPMVAVDYDPNGQFLIEQLYVVFIPEAVRSNYPSSSCMAAA